MIEIKVGGSVVSVQETVLLYSGSAGTHICHFTFDAGWDNFRKSAVFRVGGRAVTAFIDEESCCALPWELLTRANIGLQIEVGVYGVSTAAEVLTTVWDSIGTVRDGSELGNDAREPGEGVYDQIMAGIQRIDEKVVSYNEQAQAQAASFANPTKMVVLIDEEKIEKMATDENFRAQYEGVIANAAAQMNNLGNQISSGNYSNVTAYGIQLNDDGTTSFFAVLDEQLEVNKERLEKQLEKKADERKAEKKEADRERLEGIRNGDGKKIVTAASVEELLVKIQDANFESRSNNVMTEQEKLVGQKFDFSI